MLQNKNTFAQGIEYEEGGAFDWSWSKVGYAAKGNVARYAVQGLLTYATQGALDQNTAQAITSGVTQGFMSGYNTRGNMWEFEWDYDHATEHLTAGLAAGLSSWVSSLGQGGETGEMQAGENRQGGLDRDTGLGRQAPPNGLFGSNLMMKDLVAGTPMMGDLTSGAIYSSLMTGMYHATGGKGFANNYYDYDWNSLVFDHKDIGNALGNMLVDGLKLKKYGDAAMDWTLGLASDIGESMLNLVTGDGWNTNEEVANNQRIQEGVAEGRGLQEGTYDYYATKIALNGAQSLTPEELIAFNSLDTKPKYEQEQLSNSEGTEDLDRDTFAFDSTKPTGHAIVASNSTRFAAWLAQSYDDLSPRTRALVDSVFYNAGSTLSNWNRDRTKDKTAIYNASGRATAISEIEDNEPAFLAGYQYWGKNSGLLVPNKDDTYWNIIRSYSKGQTEFIRKEKLSNEQAQDIMKKHTSSSEGWNTFCNLATGQISENGYDAPNLQYYKNKEFSANSIYDNLARGDYNTEFEEFARVSWDKAEQYASKGGLAIAVWRNNVPGKSGHIATLEGGYVGKKSMYNLRIFQAGRVFGHKRYSEGFGSKRSLFYIWKKRKRKK